MHKIFPMAATEIAYDTENESVVVRQQDGDEVYSFWISIQMVPTFIKAVRAAAAEHEDYSPRQ